MGSKERWQWNAEAQGINKLNANELDGSFNGHALSGNDPKTIVGIAWYRPEQWGRLRGSAADPEELEATYEEWLAIAKQTVDLARKGVRAERVDIDIESFTAWCDAKGCARDASARAWYATERLRAKYEDDGNDTT